MKLSTLFCGLKSGIYLLAFLFFGLNYVDATAVQSNSRTLLSEQQLVFIENKGQWNPEVLFLCRLGGMDAWISKDGVNYTFYGNSNSTSALSNTLKGHRVNFELVTNNAAVKVETKPIPDYYVNYFSGNDPSKYRSKVPVHKEVIIKNVYDDIDIRYYFDNAYLRFDFMAAPQADVSRIAFKLTGQEDAMLNKQGDLVLKTSLGDVSIAGLKTFQSDNKVVASRFEKSNDIWKIRVDNYDREQALTIDPLVFSTFIGGSIFDVSLKSAINQNFPLSANALQTTFGGGSFDAIVGKLNANGTQLLYATLLGGSQNDNGTSINIDQQGNALITGTTNSPDFISTEGSFKTTSSGLNEVFVTKLNLSAITSINEIIKDDVLQIYPNPARSTFAVKGAVGEKVEIFDSFGRAVYATTLHSDNQLINPGLTPGVYFIKSENREAAKLILLE